MKKKSYKRLVAEDGSFKSEFPGGTDGQGYSVGYLEDLCEWIYYHDNKTDNEKMTEILIAEKIIKKYLSKCFASSMSINYIPTWSKKLQRKIARNKNKENE